MNRTLIECPLCPCRFLTQVDLDHHMRGFTTDPIDHIRRYVSNMSYPQKLKRKRGRELYSEYLKERGVKPHPRSKKTKKPKKEALSLNQRLERYAVKIDLFRHNYCNSNRSVNRPPCKPPLPGSWLAKKMEEADR